jgi:hypothetical protein
MIKVKIEQKEGNWKGKPNLADERDRKLASQFKFDA